MNILALILAIDINWSSIIDPIGNLFINDVAGNPIIAALLLFFIMFLLTLIFGLGMIVGSVIIIPTLFMVFEFIPGLEIIVAIIIGLGFGIALNRLIKR